MSLTVYKYPIPIEDEFNLELPIGAKILKIELQGNHPNIWALVNSENENQKRSFRFAGTGHSLPEKELNYIGSVHMNSGQLVFHLFEVL